MKFRKLITHALFFTIMVNASDLSFNACDNGERNSLDLAYEAALDMAKDARSAVAPIDGNLVGDRYTYWFGEANTARVSEVKETVNRIYDVLHNKEISFDCAACKEDLNYYKIYAYVVPDEEYIVNPCGVFWTLDLNGTDSQGGTIIHGLSHFLSVGETKDYAYGQENAENLAKNDPDKAVNNADSYEYLFENNPKLNMIVDFDNDGINDDIDTDDDNDGISDIDEIRNGLNPKDASDASKDIDNDGFSNSLEITVGSDIRDEYSFPSWVPIVIDGSITIFIPVDLED